MGLTTKLDAAAMLNCGMLCAVLAFVAAIVGGVF